MKKTPFYSLILALAFVSCAQEPSAVVASGSSFGGNNSLEGTDIVTKSAVSFNGFDLDGNSCGLNISMIEEKGENLFLINLDYRLHGLALPDVEASLYRFSLRGSPQYSTELSDAGLLTLGAALLRDESEADLNELTSYESQGLLEYSVRIETSSSSATDFENSLLEVINDPTKLSSQSDKLNVMRRVVLKIGHGNHYDPALCTDLELSSNVGQVSFELGHHDGHDHGDDHDHDEDHGDDDHNDDEDHGDDHDDEGHDEDHGDDHNHEND